MRIEDEVIEAAMAVEKQEDVSADVLLAVAIVETRAVAFAAVGERREPLIRFEGHYFDRRLSAANRRVARAAGLSHPRAGAVRNPAAQAARWAMLERASAIDANAAYASTSWGLGQVMGAHYEVLGFATPREMAELARRSAEGQFEIVARLLKLGRLDRILEAGDHAGFARRYNGPGFAANSYDTKIAEARRLARNLLRGAGAIAQGTRQAEVRTLQRALSEGGFPLVADGVFGPLTAAALEAFHERFCVRTKTQEASGGWRIGSG